MTRRTVADHNGEPVHLGDVYHADDADLRVPSEMTPAHDPERCEYCAAGTCWIARARAGRHLCLECDEFAVERHHCVRHQPRSA